MDASLRSRTEQLASEMAGQATTVEDLKGLMRVMMKSALERMLGGGRREGGFEIRGGERPAELQSHAKVWPVFGPIVGKVRELDRRGRQWK